MHVHDEIVTEARIGQSLDPIKKAMTTMPYWADGLPLAIKAFETHYYKK